MTLRFGTVGSPDSTPKSGTDQAIKQIRQLELDALEVAWVRSVRVKDETCQVYKNIAQEQDVKLSIHAPYYINLNSQTADKMKASDERLLAAARKGFLAGATDIIFHPGSYHEQPPEQVYDRVRQKLQELCGILQNEGVDVVLRPETMGKSAMFGSLDEVLQLSKDIEGVAPCIDIAHLHARPGDGSFNTYEEFAGMFKAVQEMLGTDKGLHDVHFHLSGIAYTDAGEREHLVLEESDLNWRDFIQACVDFDVQGRLVGESPNLEEDVLMVRQYYLDLLEN